MSNKQIILHCILGMGLVLMGVGGVFLTLQNMSMKEEIAILQEKQKEQEVINITQTELNDSTAILLETVAENLIMVMEADIERWTN